jgi:hypothetical protein
VNDLVGLAAALRQFSRVVIPIEGRRAAAVAIAISGDSDRSDGGSYPTRSGYVITPVVVRLPPGQRLTPSPAEVAELHRIPLADLGVQPRFLLARRAPPTRGVGIAGGARSRAHARCGPTGTGTAPEEAS